MEKKTLICLAFFSLYTFVLIAQCPPRDSIRINIIEQKFQQEKSADRQLAFLLKYNDSLKKCSIRGDSVSAWLLWTIGGVYYDQNKFSEALNYFLPAIEIGKSLTPGNLGNEALINQYYWVYTIYTILQNEAEKRKASDSCIAVAGRFGYPFNASLIRCLTERIQYFYDIGDYKLCINDAGICETVSLGFIKANTDAGYIFFGKRAVEVSLQWRVKALLRLGNYDEAEKLLAKKIELYKKENAANDFGAIYSQQAEVSEIKGNYLQSLNYFKQALKIYREKKDYFNCKQTLNNIAWKIYFKHLKDYDQALVCFRNALAYTNSIDFFNRADSSEILSIYGRMANTFVEKGLFDSSSVCFQLAFNQVRKGAAIDNILYSSEDEFNRFKKMDYLLELLISYGDSYKRKYESKGNIKDIGNAAGIYFKADKFLARLNISQFNQESKLLWRAESRRLYEHAIEACYFLKDPDRAFYFFERSRAVLLNIQLAEKNFLKSTDISRLNELKERIAELSSVINSLPDSSEKKAMLRDSLGIENDKMYGLVQSIKSGNPLYYQNMDTIMAGIPDVRKKLLADYQAIIEMFSGDSAVYSLLITDKTAFVSKINKNDFAYSVNAYTYYISNYEILNRNFTAFRNVSHHLYELLLSNAPFPKGRIIISPEGYYFPFESLITDNTPVNPAYFIVEHAVSYAYSVRYLLNNFTSTATTAKGGFLGMAPVDYSAHFKLAELSGSDVSLKNIQAFMHRSEIYQRSDATRGNFLHHFPDYKMIQLYTHASDSSDRSEPVIYFNDSALYLSELKGISTLATELIILSACETANGKLYQGEGVFSFNRAFAALGIPSSITNLWAISNKSTYIITESFYKNISDGLPMDVALQKAKMAYMNDEGDAGNQLPYFWAAPILVGKAGFIPHEKSYLWEWILLIAGLVILCYASWRAINRFRR
jgi:tetratricopeptide (TPR) repeat protein